MPGSGVCRMAAIELSESIDARNRSDAEVEVGVVQQVPHEEEELERLRVAVEVTLLEPAQVVSISQLIRPRRYALNT